jgi:hypothetical protein
MAIKKALYGRQPGCFSFDFSFEYLLQQESFIFSLSGVFNKVPSFAHFECFGC